MSNAIFPTLPGLAWSVYKTPEWDTSMQRAISGKEIRRANRSRPIWQFSLSYEFLRGANGFSEFQTLLAFFNARQGSFDSFLLNDTSDNTAAAVAIGTGDGVTKRFQLMHVIGGWSEPIGYAPSPAPLVNGSAQPFTTDGQYVTFNTAPPGGMALTWSGTFYYRVRFAKDSVDFEQFFKDFWLLKKCDLVGVI